MKLNEKVKNYIIICLGALLLVSGIFSTCNNNGGSISDREITRGLHFITNTIQDSIKLLSSIKGSINDIAGERDRYRQLAEQFRENYTKLESRYNELQSDYIEFKDYEQRTIQANRNIIAACDRLGIEIETLGRNIEDSGGTISRICEATEQPKK